MAKLKTGPVSSQELRRVERERSRGKAPGQTVPGPKTGRRGSGGLVFPQPEAPLSWSDAPKFPRAAKPPPKKTVSKIETFDC